MTDLELDQNENSGQPSVGAQLRQARTAKQLTIADVAATLRLSAHTIECLETDVMDDAMNPMYYRGYLGSYVRFLGLDAQAVLGVAPTVTKNRFRSQELASVSGPPVFKHARVAPRRFRYVSWLIALGLALLVFVWKYEQAHHVSSPIALPALASNQQAIALPVVKPASTSSFRVSPIKSIANTEK